MRAQITAIQFKASDSLKEFTQQEVQRLEKFSEDIIKCEVEFSYQKTEKEAHIHISVNGTVLNAVEKSDDFKKSVALAVDKLEQQLKKLKGKQQARRLSEE